MARHFLYQNDEVVLSEAKDRMTLLSFCILIFGFYILSGFTLSAKAQVLPVGLAYTGTEVPVIHPRSTWENDAGLKALLTWLPKANHVPPDYALVERVIVHDQGCGNPQACTENATKFPLETIQNIYRFHAVTRGWGDIGYNYIIDREGRIYEGRFGGNGVRAAHLYHDAACQNFNIGSAGILLLGDLRAGPMTTEQERGLSRLTAWLGAANGFDPNDPDKISRIWTNPEGTGGCDYSRGSFTADFIGPTLLSHGDIEKGNSDFFDLSSLRPKAAELAVSFKRFAYKSTKDPSPLVIQGGGLFLMPSDFAPSSVLDIAATQLDLFPFRQVRALADGTLIKSPVSPDVYVMESGQRRIISAPILFALLGYRRETIQEIPDRELIQYPQGTPKMFPERTLVQVRGEKDVFVAQSGFLRHISSASLFNAFGFVWSQIFKLLPEDFEDLPVAEALKFSDGTLIKGSAPWVYLVEKGARRPVGSASLFTTLGLNWGDIVSMENYELERYPVATFLQWPDETLIRATNDARVWLVQKGYRRWIATRETFVALNLRWENVKSVLPEELAAYPEGFPIQEAADVEGVPAPEKPLQGEEAERGEVSSSQVPNPPQVALSQEPAIRIGIFNPSEGAQTTVSVDGSYRVEKNAVVIAEKNVNEMSEIPSPGTADIYRVIPADPHGVVTIHSYDARPTWNPTLNDNQFRGVIEVRRSAVSGKVWVINEALMEDYMKGIAETINGDPKEYGKAFAIAARSYALYYQMRGGKHAGEPFHLKNTSGDQIYKGYGFEKRAYDPVSAVEATRGMVAVFTPSTNSGQAGAPILAAYSSGAPGVTLSACTVWGNQFCEPSFDYLDGGVPDPAGTTFQYQSCTGAVHCVGLDAAGARKMAETGSVGEQILKTYYTGIMLEQRWE